MIGITSELAKRYEETLKIAVEVEEDDVSVLTVFLVAQAVTTKPNIITKITFFKILLKII